MQARGYTLDLYCDAPGCNSGEYGAVRFGQYFGETGGEARKKARKDGWAIAMPGVDDKDLCRWCRLKGGDDG